MGGMRGDLAGGMGEALGEAFGEGDKAKRQGARARKKASEGISSMLIQQVQGLPQPAAIREEGEAGSGSAPKTGA